jgi:AcrR family transcriptional regulator
MEPGGAVVNARRGAEDGGAQLWFAPPPGPGTGRRSTLTRERVVTEALATISAEGVEALSMRSLARRLKVVPGALYRHVHSKEQLHDLVLDAVLAEVDVRTDPGEPWTERVTTLARRLRDVLEVHPGVAGLLKRRAPLTPHSLALAEAFLDALKPGAPTVHAAALGYHLIHDYTVGFALPDRASATEERLQDPSTRRQLLDFLRSLPVDRFPLLGSMGELIWLDDRDERFSANLHTLIRALGSS